MKTEQEQRRAIRQILFDANEICQAIPCENELCMYYGDYRCYDNVIVDKLIRAGYGDVTEYKAEIERLKAETSNIRKEMAREILDMLYDMGIDKGILECCRICDVNGVSLAKQICEKYGVEIEK